MNMKRTFNQGVKRAFAFVLTVCMLFSILPVGAFEAPSGVKAQAASEVITYNFLNRDAGTIEFIVNGQVNSKFTNYDHIAKGEGKWKYYSHDSTSSYFRQNNTYGLYMNYSANNTKYKFLTYFDGNGYYSVDAKIGDWKEIGAAKLSLIPCDENGENQKAAITLGMIDGSSESNGAWNKLTHVGKVNMSAGYYILEISNTYERISSSERHSIMVLGSLDFTKLALDVNVEPPAPVAIGESVVTEIKLADASALNTPVECTAVSATSSIASFALNEDGNLEVTAGDTAGKEVVAVTFTANGKTETVNMPIIVYDPADYTAATYEYKFYKGSKTTNLKDTMTSYNRTSAGATGEYKSAVASSPWKIGSSDFNMTFTNSHMYNYGIYVNGKNGAVKVHFYLPSSGNYNLFSTSRTHSAYNCPVSFSIQRADGTGKYAEETAIGSISVKGSAAARQTEDFQVGNTSLELEAGEYILTYNVQAANSYFFPLSFRLVGLGDVGLGASVTAPTEPVEIGKTVSLPLAIAKGDVIDYNSLKIDSVKSSDGEIVTATLEKDVAAKTAAIVLEGKKFGSTELTVALSASGYQGDVSFRVAARYAADAQPVGKNLVFNMLKGFIDNGVDTIETLTYDKVMSINADKTSEPWALFGRRPENVGELNAGGNAMSYVKYNYASYGIACWGCDDENLPATAQLKLQVPTTGWYNISVTPLRNGGKAITQMNKYNAIENTVGDVVLASQILDVETSSGTGDIQLNSEPIELEAGEYIFEYGANTNNVIILNAINLEYIGKEPIIFKIEPQTSSAAVVAGKSIEMPVNITYTVGGTPVEFDYTNAVVDVSSTDANVAVATANKTASGISFTVEGKTAGAASISATVTVGNYKKSFSFTVMVDDGKVKDLYYDFKKAFSKLCDVEFITGITYAHTTTGSPSEMNVGKYPTTPWEFHSKKTDGYIRWNYENNGIVFYQPGTLNLKLRVSADGYYKPSVLFHRHIDTWYGKMQSKLYKYNAETNEIGDLIAQSGVYGATQISIKQWFDLGDEAVYLTAGEYILSTSLAKATGGTGNLCGSLDAFRLDAVKLMPETPASIEIGETVEIPAFRGIKLACDTLAASAAQKGIVSVEVDKTTGIIKLTGLAAGETTLTATAEGDQGGSYTIPVKVIDPAAPNAKSVTMISLRLTPLPVKSFGHISFSIPITLLRTEQLMRLIKKHPISLMWQTVHGSISA